MFLIVPQDQTTALRARSFGAVADEYNRLRPSPPPEALDWLLPEAVADVLEIGAGTGLLTVRLAERVRHVTAVEPDERMRSVLASRGARLDIVAGSGEEIPVPASSVDVVIAQSAWHWVDEARTVPEVARVLRPEGRLSLAWTGTDRSVDWMRALWAGGTDLTLEQSVQVDSHRQRRHVVHLDAAGPSPFHEPETTQFRWTTPMAKQDLVALAATYSVVITMDEDSRREHLDGMARYLESREEFADRDVIDVPMRSHCWRAAKR